RLEAAGTIIYAVLGWSGDDRCIFFHGRVADVGGQHRHHVRRLVAFETGVLKNRKLAAQFPVVNP
ncbi:MAG TPA: hypothetical protein VF430_03300, partial [Verrucomicrobiae bacterium]